MPLDGRDRLVRLGMDVFDVLVVCHALRLLHDERARGGTDVLHKVHGADLEDGLAVDGRMLVVRATEPNVLGLDGEVELL